MLERIVSYFLENSRASSNSFSSSYCFPLSPGEKKNWYNLLLPLTPIHTRTQYTWFSLSKKKKKSHGCHCRLRRLEGDAKVESDPDWLIYELFESIQRNQIEREQSSFVPQSAKTTTKKMRLLAF